MKVTVTRNNIVQEVLALYRRQPELVHTFLEVVFEGEEEAADLEGVAKELFTIFMREFALQHLVGNCQKCPDMNHPTLDEDTFEVSGRIVSHAFVLLEYPPIIADASMAWLLCGQVSADELLASVLDFVSDDDADTLRHVLAHPEQLSDRTLLNKCLRITTGLGEQEDARPECQITSGEPCKVLLDSSGNVPSAGIQAWIAVLSTSVDRLWS